MLLKVFNQILIDDREKTYLTASASAGNTSITVADTDLIAAATSSTTWANNDYMLVGNFGEERAEVMQMSAAVTSATALSIDREGETGGLRFDHPIGTPIYRIDFNRVQFLRSATDDSSASSALTTIQLQPDDLYTRYEDTANSTGYGFARFNNATTGAFSSYSDGVNYEISGQASSRDPNTLFSMRRKVRQTLNEFSDERLKDYMIDDAINDKQRDIAHQRLWSFFEIERSFSAVANQFAYTLPSEVNTVHTCRFDTQPLIWISRSSWENAHWDTNQSSADPSHFNQWNRQLEIFPRPSSAAATTTINQGGGISATATSVTVASTSSFNRGDFYRFIIDSEVIYATNSTSTTFTGLSRGMEGTTAASHADAATITERDLVYTASREPVNLLDTSDRTPIAEPDVLVYGAAIDLAPIVGKEKMIATFNSKYEFKMKQLKEKYALKQTSQTGRVKDVSETIKGNFAFTNPNLFPKDITGS